MKMFHTVIEKQIVTLIYISISIMPLVYGPIGVLHYPWYNFQYKNLDHVTYFHQWEFIILVNFTQGATQGALTQFRKYMMYIFFFETQGIIEYK